MTNSRQKGARGERELASLLREFGWGNSRRGCQYNGLDGEDVVGLPGFHIECKRVEKFNAYDALEQAVRDAKGVGTPVVFHRRNNCDWIVVLRAGDFLRMVAELEPLDNPKRER